ncbi:hypothetical protein Fleli_0651 [Bernardetia litoralis DSM 6794]|uniref:Uncharacterized protein n=1 Tax=Bernardetia litoralis (strain ATCC 23117 / DSM 6794 / NBRC 15988 / NCIMB 1366 / Fx l1 / Sio-4) TaxID=880071 RepID=I4AGM9_BERLS|nr:hypothetical protein [Bernardetia litoralis]AFM03114.1 hypothetical protein Fleli_0651 [Bernardetia litoralis DSM 6794]
MNPFKINILSFLSSWFPKKILSNKLEKPLEEKTLKKTTTENNLSSSSKENDSIYYLPVHLM